MTTKKAGRPTKMTEVTLQKLEQAFAWGCSDIEACVFAGINKSTLYDYCTKNPGFTDRKETLKTTPTMKAKMIIYKAIEDGDLATANKVIDRKEGSRVKAELTGRNGERLQAERTVFNFVPVSNDSDMSQDQATAIYKDLLNG